MAQLGKKMRVTPAQPPTHEAGERYGDRAARHAGTEVWLKRLRKRRAKNKIARRSRQINRSK